MTRALVAVGAALALSFLVLGAVVYALREEEKPAVDSALAETLGREIVEARGSDQPIDLAELTKFNWDRVLIVERRTPREEIEQALGIDFEGEVPYDVESSAVLIFARGDSLARYADYRGLVPFEGLPVTLERDRALLDVGESVRPVSGG